MSTLPQIDAGDIIRRQAETIASLTVQIIQLELTAEALRRERDEARAGARQEDAAEGDDRARVVLGRRE